jgi:hypothetical protein
MGAVSDGACNGGSYIRVGYAVLYDFVGCVATVTGPPATLLPGGQPTKTTFGKPVDIRVAGLLVPDVTKGSNGVTTPVADAFFQGVGAAASST